MILVQNFITIINKDLEIHNELEATEILKKLSNAFNIESVDKKEKSKKI